MPSLQNQGQGIRGCAMAALLLSSCLLAVVENNTVAASSYTVGDANGWDLGVNYAIWAQKYSFAEGDTLVFQYTNSTHSVNQVSKADYQSCSLNNVLNAYTSGNDAVTLSTSASYFICGTPGHCAAGMKLAILTSSSTNSSAPISPPAPGGGATTGSPPSPGSNTSTTPSAPGPSNSRALPLQPSASEKSILILTMAALVVASFLM